MNRRNSGTPQRAIQIPIKTRELVRTTISTELVVVTLFHDVFEDKDLVSDRPRGGALAIEVVPWEDVGVMVAFPPLMDEGKVDRDEVGGAVKD